MSDVTNYVQILRPVKVLASKIPRWPMGETRCMTSDDAWAISLGWRMWLHELFYGKGSGGRMDRWMPWTKMYQSRFYQEQRGRR